MMRQHRSFYLMVYLGLPYLLNDSENTKSTNHILHERSTWWWSFQFKKTCHFWVFFAQSIFNVEHFSQTVFDFSDWNTQSWNQHLWCQLRQFSLRKIFSQITCQFEQFVLLCVFELFKSEFKWFDGEKMTKTSLSASMEKIHFWAREDNTQFWIEFGQFLWMWSPFWNIHQVVNVLDSWNSCYIYLGRVSF